MTDQPTQPAYNPAAHVQRIKRGAGSYDYMQVKDRVLWFRADNPDGIIQCDAVQINIVEGFAIIKATISAPGRGLAEGLGSCTRQELLNKAERKAVQPDQVESFTEFAETAAVGRALAHLGYGTENAITEAGFVDTPHQRQDERQDGASPGQAQGQAPTSPRQATHQATTAANTNASDSPLKRAKKACWEKIRPLWPDEDDALGVLAELLRTSSNRIGATLEGASLTDWEKLAGELANGKIQVPAPEPAPLF